MDNDIAIVHDDPAVTGVALFFAFLLVLLADVIDGGVGKRVEHAVTGAGADNEIVGKRNDLFQVDQDDILPFGIFQRVYDFAGKF
jgi:hypothetical protein